MSSASVSVIIPAYNYARFLPDAIGSVLNQGMPAEIIVVDDGSTDDISGVIAPYANRILFLRQPNRGLSAARNLGISAASGRYLLFLDADDMLGPGVIAEQVAALEAGGGKGMAVCRNYLFSEKDAEGNPVPNAEWRRFSDRLDIHLCHFNIGPPPAFLVRRDAVLDVGGFDPGLRACEDHDLWFRLSLSGHLPFLGASARVYYRRHCGSMSQNQKNQHLHDLEMHLRIGKSIMDGAPARGDAIGSRSMACCAGMLLTASRLPEEGRAPLWDPLLALLSASLSWPASDSFLYDFFLARVLMLSRRFQEQEALSQHIDAIGRCVERAGRRAWLAMPTVGVQAMIESWENEYCA